jgi:presenilin-like A22 family membrane protease
MKHSVKVTAIIFLLFITAHFIGLFVTNTYLVDDTLPMGIERPEVNEEISYIPIIIAIIIATALILLLIKFNAFKIWKAWFFIAVTYALLISFGAFVQQYIALGLAFGFAIFKVIKPNMWAHNISELFIYGGLAGVFVPILNFMSISILLILISIYDMIAVWKTKHMVKMAKFQTKSKLFAGLLIPYDKDKVAVLGGGDIGFPLLFSGVILKTSGMINAGIVSLFAGIALILLLTFSKKKKFYPAMPFLTAGCLVGWLITLLV